jgi:uncharacterized protein (TIGR00290 family)
MLAGPEAASDTGVVLYWSGGKDCALALHQLHTTERFKGFRVSCLLTTFTDAYDRVSDHGIRRELIERQAAVIGIDLHKTYIPPGSTMATYEATMEAALAVHRARGIRLAASGDIFVEKQRVAMVKKMGFQGCFPLWEKTTREQIGAFLASGIKAYVVCVDSAILDPSFVGKPLDAEFLRRLPSHVDPCGERGEYHTFAYDGPMFREPVRCRIGEVVLRESLYFSDVIPD